MPADRLPESIIVPLRNEIAQLPPQKRRARFQAALAKARAQKAQNSGTKAERAKVKAEAIRAERQTYRVTSHAALKVAECEAKRARFLDERARHRRDLADLRSFGRDIADSLAWRAEDLIAGRAPWARIGELLGETVADHYGEHEPMPRALKAAIVDAFAMRHRSLPSRIVADAFRHHARLVRSHRGGG